MLVKAKWNVKDAGGWHDAGEVFNTEQDLGDAIEVLDAPKKAAPKKEPENVSETSVKEPAKAETVQRSATRRKSSK